MMPILMLTAKALPEDKHTGFLVGTDDYMTKPPDKTELLLRDEIWGIDSESDDKTVNVHINRLRNRFYDWPEFETQTVRGLGYRAVKKV